MSAACGSHRTEWSLGLLLFWSSWALGDTHGCAGLLIRVTGTPNHLDPEVAGGSGLVVPNSNRTRPCRRLWGLQRPEQNKLMVGRTSVPAGVSIGRKALVQKPVAVFDAVDFALQCSGDKPPKRLRAFRSHHHKEFVGLKWTLWSCGHREISVVSLRHSWLVHKKMWV